MTKQRLLILVVLISVAAVVYFRATIVVGHNAAAVLWQRPGTE